MLLATEDRTKDVEITTVAEETIAIEEMIVAEETIVIEEMIVIEGMVVIDMADGEDIMIDSIDLIDGSVEVEDSNLTLSHQSFQIDQLSLTQLHTHIIQTPTDITMAMGMVVIFNSI